jgi:hemolysin D
LTSTSAKQADLKTRSDAVNLQAQQLQQQLNQARVKYNTAQQTLAVNAQILGRVEPLAREGAISQIQFLKQQQEVTSNQSEVDQLVQEQGRIQFAIAETKSKVQNSIAVDGRDVMALLSANEQKIAEIDSQFTKAILENEKHISEMDSQIRQTAQMLKYSDIKAPADGAVFEMKPSAPGYVANAAEPRLKIVPQEDLIAKVTITNQDIGFLKPGMDVDVRVDSFPFSEFGDIKGTLVSIGSDALPPTQEKPYYSFPAKIKLKRQTINVKGQEIKLQSGMSLSVNVKTRSRKVIDIFTEQFKKGSESLKFVR